MKYSSLLTIKAIHTYDLCGDAADLVISPTPDTARLLENLRCTVRYLSQGVIVHKATTQTGNLLSAFPPNSQLSFELKSNHPDFALFTDLAQSPTVSGLTIEHIKPSNCLHVKTQNDLLSLLLNPPVYTITLPALAVPWVYYVVSDMSTAPNNFSIKDGNTSGAQNRKWVDISNETQTGDAVQLMLTKTHPAAQIRRFISDQPIQFSRLGVRDIQLWAGSSKLLDHLPNPSFRSVLMGPSTTTSQQQLAVFEIVKYLRNPSLSRV